MLSLDRQVFCLELLLRALYIVREALRFGKWFHSRLQEMVCEQLHRGTRHSHYASLRILFTRGREQNQFPKPNGFNKLGRWPMSEAQVKKKG
jgi:hypothetical protein